MLSQLGQIISDIPDVIWSALIASGVTLFGVHLSNKGNTERLEAQLEHDRSQKSADRIATLRRDVVLAAAAETSAALNLLSTLAERDSTATVHADLRPYHLSMAKLHVSSETRTALMVTDFTARYASAMKDAFIMLMPVYALRAELRNKEQLRDMSLAHANRINLKMQEYHATSQKDRSVFEALSKTSEFYLADVETKIREANAIRQDIAVKTLDYAEWVGTIVIELNTELIPLILAVRSDVGIETDREVYTSEIVRRLRIQQQQLTTFLDNIKAQIRGVKK